jgi:DNA-binding MarR family transcriptional regulator
MTSDNAYPLYDSEGYWIGRLAQAMLDDFTRGLTPNGATGAQWTVLNALYYGHAQSPAELASHIGIDRSAITRLVDRLEAKGLVVRQQDPTDRRGLTLALTPTGQDLVPTLQKVAQATRAKFVLALSPDEVQQLHTIVQKMLRAGGIDVPPLWQSPDALIAPNPGEGRASCNHKP